MKKMAFIVHLRDIEDISYIFFPIPKIILKVLRRFILYLFQKLKGRWGFIVRSRFKINENTQGYILVILLTGQQMMTLRQARHRILKAVIYAQDKLDCSVIGLGALTASTTDAGRWLIKQPGIKANITHGDSFATVLAVKGIREIAHKVGLKLNKSTIAIVGATGIIGKALVQILAPETGKLVLVGRNLIKLRNLCQKVENFGDIEYTSEIERIKIADIIVTATSSPGALIQPEYLKQSVVIYEVSQPRNVSFTVAQQRPDALIVDGCYAQVPKNINFWWMSLPSHYTFGCMAETIILSLEGLTGHHVGDIDLNFIEEIKNLSEKYGFTHARLTSFNRPLNLTP